MPGVTADLADVDAFLDAAPNDEALHAVVVDGEIVGHCSLHDRGEGVGEIGYWVRTDRTGRGFATSAVLAVVESAPQGIDRFEIHCDEGNAASARVAVRAGFHLLETVDVERRTPAQSGREQIWVRPRAALAARVVRRG